MTATVAEWRQDQHASFAGDAGAPPHAHDSGDHGGHPSPWGRLWRLLQPEWRDVWSVTVFAMVISVLSLATPMAVESLVNTIAFGRLIQPLAILSLILFTFLGFSAAFRTMQAYVAEVIQRRLFARVVADLAWRLPRWQFQARDREHGPEMVNRFFDVMTIQKTAASLVLDGIGIVLQSVVGMILLAVYHPFLLGFDLILLAAVAVVVIGLGRGAVTSSIRESYAKHAVGGWLEQLAHFPAVFRSDGGNLAFTTADQLTVTYLRARKAHFRILIRQVVFALALQAAAGTVLLGLGGWLVMQGQLTLGQLVAAELIVSVIVGSFAKLGKQVEAFYDLMAAVDKVGHLLDLPIERTAGMTLAFSERPAAIRLRSVQYRYSDDGPGLLGPLSLDAQPGEFLAVMGAPASGKTTLLEILYGLREPSQGHVELDGCDYRSLHPDDIRRQVALAGVPEAFGASIEVNLHLGSIPTNADGLRQALQDTQLWDELMRLPEGLRTELQAGGRPLSNSQVARLTLARALVANPRLLLVDGLLDSLPEELADSILRALRSRCSRATVFLVTGRKALAQSCDRVIDLGTEHFAPTSDPST